ncbi:RNA methyltransferase [Gramella sp. GC03-9]|uniref:RNA methyltransferase n=1 Tax=Christiangramia oceanisediminis TaxID=2920386 RepID=A0A9X2I864_9FLAO|nr:RNA methyltransferase [Gramella oceanisediminis]MCP9198458.1 RNA methyltransferase [Gramella oceanisediminis]
MVSKNQIKLIKSLSQKKFRNKHKLFVVEGIKGIEEFLKSDIELFSLFSSTNSFGVSEDKWTELDEGSLKKISFLSNPQGGLAIFKIPELEKKISAGLILALDGVRDPGNLGTIIRLCDWYGIEDLVCSNDTVDCFNPKVVQASMGSLARVNVRYLDLQQFMKDHQELPVYGTLLEGQNIYSEELPENGIIVMGNEANGISEEIKALVNKKLNIPQFGKIQKTESLNVATATAIVLSEFKRRSITEK